MKKLTLLLLGLLALTATSCGSRYNEKTCDDLIEKYDDKGKLNSQDLAEAIRQVDAIIDNLDSRLDKIKSLAEAKDEEAIDLWDGVDDETIGEHFNKLTDIIRYADNADELKGENKKAYKDLEKKIKSFSRKAEKTEKKVRRLKRRLDY